VVRKDATMRFRGGYLEVRFDLDGEVELRFDPKDDAASRRVFFAWVDTALSLGRQHHHLILAIERRRSKPSKSGPRGTRRRVTMG
jgi:hypothetical protein